METYIFRHEESGYTQGKVSLGRASDLLPGGTVRVGLKVQHLGNRLTQGRAVRITSSPYGRTLHTARLISDVLREGGHNVEGIIPDERLEEIRDFDRSLFLALVNGGNIDNDDSRFTINPSFTNPGKLSATNYFRSDAHHNLSS